MSRVVQIRQMLVNDPKDPFLRHALALEYLKEGKEEEAKDQFVELLRDEPGYVGSYYHLALLLERMGKREEAIRYFETGMKMAVEKGDRHALNELRSAYEEMMM